ncbi:heme peroxidase [Parathielavia hyrcaniae]|uniref:Heme peroxidase n=1 Tax=Parathielavia hyrcaniae TaxID=113614 RepID=A0AAN6PZK3_9PEZI|nr:heme peroxidase [Parathielavia hyrcaniae]
MAPTNNPANGVHASSSTHHTVKPGDNEQPFPAFKPSFLERIGIGGFKLLNKYNLHDGYASAEAQGNANETPLPDERYRGARHSDGKFNSLERPHMGCRGMRFGRNFPRHLTAKPTEEELWTPNPRMISDKFMARRDGRFIPATTLNMLAAAWIHEEKFEVPLPEGGEPWPHPRMELFRTQPDEVRDPSDIKCPGYNNENMAWWDGSQIYGSSEEVTHKLRTKLPDGKLELDAAGGSVSFLPRDKDGNPLTGFHNNWWIGLEMRHTLFAMEHNAFCDALKAAYPGMTG